MGDSECGRHEMELENDEHDRLPKIRDIECKENSDECLKEVSGSFAFCIVCCIIIDRYRFVSPFYER